MPRRTLFTEKVDESLVERPTTNALRHLLLSALEHLGVELKLLTLEDVAIDTAALARSGGNAGQQTTGGELLVKGRVKGAGLLALGSLSLDVVRRLLLLSALSSGLLGSSLLDTDLDTVVLLVPGLERSGIDLDDGVLHQGLGAHQLVVGGVVDDVQHTGLSGGDCCLKSIHQANTLISVATSKVCNS